MENKTYSPGRTTSNNPSSGGKQRLRPRKITVRNKNKNTSETWAHTFVNPLMIDCHLPVGFEIQSKKRQCFALRPIKRFRQQETTTLGTNGAQRGTVASESPDTGRKTTGMHEADTRCDIFTSRIWARITSWAIPRCRKRTIVSWEVTRAVNKRKQRGTQFDEGSHKRSKHKRDLLLV